MSRTIARLALSPDQQIQIERWLAALGTPQQVALRCRIILAVAAGKTESAIAAENGVNARRSVSGESDSVRRVCRRFGRLLRAGDGKLPMMRLV